MQPGFVAYLYHVLLSDRIILLSIVWFRYQAEFFRYQLAVAVFDQEI
jgi:hypothetical protein